MRLPSLFAIAFVTALAAPALAQAPGERDPYAEPAAPPPRDPYAAPPSDPYAPPPSDPYAPPPAPYLQPGVQPAPLPARATRATFVSTAETRWDVRIDGNAACTTPCSLLVEPLRYVTLHSQDRAPTKLSVGYMPDGDVMVQATPRAQGAFAAGVTFTTLSGMGLATGITLTAVGCSTDRRGMCNAGLITGVASGVGLYLSIGLIQRAMPRVHVGRAVAQPYANGHTAGVAGAF